MAHRSFVDLQHANIIQYSGTLEHQWLGISLVIEAELLQQLARNHDIIVDQEPSQLSAFNCAHNLLMRNRELSRFSATAVSTRNDAQKDIATVYGAQAVFE